MEAAVSSSMGAMGPVLRKLDLLLAPECRLQKRVKDGIRLLKEDLEEVSSALVGLSMLETPSLRAKCWMEEARELSYYAEDFVDDMMLMRKDADAKIRSFCSHRVGRVKVAQLPKLPRRSTRIDKIAQLRDLLWQASERFERYQLDAICSSPNLMLGQQHARAPALRGDAANIVGMEDSRINLIEMLNVEAEQQLKVVSIVGPAGVGKTTLAKEIFRELRGQFELRAFVCASRKLDTRRLLGSILCQVRHRQLPSVAGSVQNLIDNIQEQLQDKRYLIVIGDLWEEMAWDILRGAFPVGNNCSRIVATTETMNVALKCCGYMPDNILKMKPLGIQGSRNLFFSRVFGSEQQCPDELKEVSYGIIRNCGGHPLALINLAGLLASQLDCSELWCHVNDRLCSILNRRQTVEEIQKQILNFCYNSLPHCLKTCLLYFNMYPEGYTMLKSHLVKQWVAEGFVNAAEGKDREEIAEGYFDELVKRGMIRPMEIDYNDEVLSFTVHHIILDLITHNSKEEKFIAAIDCSQTMTGLSIKAHRLSLQFSSAKYAKQPAGITMSQLRSLGFFGLKFMLSIVEFKHLRVLILDCWGNRDGHMSLNLSRICILFHLRYLKISSDIMVELPAKMQGLHYLEILEIDARVSAVPLDIVHLPSLLHLGLQDATELPDGIGRIRSLNSLRYFDLRCNSEDNIRSLGKLTNLCHLHLTCSATLSSDHLKRKLIPLVLSLGKLRNLKSLTLTPDGLRAAIFFDICTSVSFPSIFLQRLELLPPICFFSRLPTGIGELHKLRILKIVVKELEGNGIRNIAGLPSLVVFSLYVRTALTGTVIFSAMAFRALKYFKFTCGVMCLDFQPGAMPNLQRIKLCFNAHRSEDHSLVLSGTDHLLNLQEVSGRIGIIPGADESNWKVVKLSFEDAIRKHPRCPRFNLQLVHFIEEEYPLDKLHRRQQKDSSGEHEIIEKNCAEEMDKHVDSSSWSPTPRRDHNHIAPGFRFYPTEEELVCFYLRNKLDGIRLGDIERAIPVANVYYLDPWQLPEAHRGVFSVDGEPWFYFCPQQEREARGGRPSRTTPSGYWKAAGTPGFVYAANGRRPIGTKKTMVFYRGHAPAGVKTKWKLNEYKALKEDDGAAAAAAAPNAVAPALTLPTRSEFTLCRLYTKFGGLRQFDRRPDAGSAVGGGSENPTAAAALANGDETGRKRNRSSSDSGGDLSEFLAWPVGRGQRQKVAERKTWHPI